MILIPTAIASANPLGHHLAGTLAASVIYGLTTSVFLHSLVLLIINTKNSYNNRTRWILITYIVFMFLISTVAIIQAFVFLTQRMSGGVDQAQLSLQLISSNEPLTLPFAIWGADGFMLWRCLILYRCTTKPQRTALRVILSVSGLASVGCGILYYIAPTLPASTNRLSLPILVSTIAISITALVNLLLTTLIAGRLVVHQEGMRRVLGPQYGSPYLRLIVTCVESCVLIVVASLAFVVLFAAGDRTRFGASIIPLLVLPHVCVLSPLLIVYHVARGRAVATFHQAHVLTPNLNIDDENLKTIQFSNALGESATRSSSSRRHSLSEVDDGGASVASGTEDGVDT